MPGRTLWFLRDPRTLCCGGVHPPKLLLHRPTYLLASGPELVTRELTLLCIRVISLLPVRDEIPRPYLCRAPNVVLARPESLMNRLQHGALPCTWCENMHFPGRNGRFRVIDIEELEFVYMWMLMFVACRRRSSL